MNFVTEADGTAGAVLIRAAEPLGGEEGPPFPLSGPGKLCAGLGVTRAETGLDLTTAGALFVTDDGAASPRLSRSRRIGVDYAGAWAARRLRFFVARNPHVSGRPR